MRVSIKDLEGIVAVINRLAGTPDKPYVKGETGRYIPHRFNSDRSVVVVRL